MSPQCNVDGCERDAVGTVLGMDGYQTAYRCMPCLRFDLEEIEQDDRLVDLTEQGGSA